MIYLCYISLSQHLCSISLSRHCLSQLSNSQVRKILKQPMWGVTHNLSWLHSVVRLKFAPVNTELQNPQYWKIYQLSHILTFNSRFVFDDNRTSKSGSNLFAGKPLSFSKILQSDNGRILFFWPSIRLWRVCGCRSRCVPETDNSLTSSGILFRVLCIKHK